MPNLDMAASWTLMARLISSSDGMGSGTSIVIASTSALRVATDSLRIIIWASKLDLDATAFSMSLAVSRIAASIPYFSWRRASF